MGCSQGGRGLKACFKVVGIRLLVVAKTVRVQMWRVAVGGGQERLGRSVRLCLTGEGGQPPPRGGGAGGVDMTPGSVAVCSWRRLLASRHLPLRFP